MLSKNKISHIKSYHQKKFREQDRIFPVEGTKMCEELLKSDFSIEVLIAEKKWIEKHKHLINNSCEIIEAETNEIEKISAFKSAPEVIALAKIPDYKIENELGVTDDICLILDGIQDPGNMGTIIRTADWFGIKNIICSLETVECFNPKVVQASMGAIFRVKNHYTQLPEFLSQFKNIDIYGTFPEGQSVYDYTLTKTGFIIMGNEGKGISGNLIPFINHRIMIPPYPSQLKNSESLNVAAATAIICNEFRRKQILSRI